MPFVSSTDAYTTVEEALAGLTRCLHVWVPFRAWLVTRVEGNDQTILQACDRENKLHAGDVLPWSASFCTRMATRGAPRFAGDAQEHAVHRSDETNVYTRMGAYVEQPLLGDDGELLGVLCAFDPVPQPPLTPDQRLLVETISKTMGLLLNGRSKVEQARQQQALLRYRAETDELTGLANRRGWEQALVDEDGALDAVGADALVIMVDLDGLKAVNDRQGHAAGDRLILKLSQVLTQQLRDVDILARLGGDEFAVLARGLSPEVGRRVVGRLEASLATAGVNASVGYAMRCEHGSLIAALGAADALMYQVKQRRRLVGTSS